MSALYQFPYWYEYIEDMHQTTIYANDGRFRPLFMAPESFSGIPTYVHWVTGRLQLDQEQERMELEEVLRETFPGYFAQPETMLPNTTGQKPQSRLWVLRRAANLLPE